MTEYSKDLAVRQAEMKARQKDDQRQIKLPLPRGGDWRLRNRLEAEERSKQQSTR